MEVNSDSVGVFCFCCGCFLGRKIFGCLFTNKNTTRLCIPSQTDPDWLKLSAKNQPPKREADVRSKLSDPWPIFTQGLRLIRCHEYGYTAKLLVNCTRNAILFAVKGMRYYLLSKDFPLIYLGTMVFQKRLQQQLQVQTKKLHSTLSFFPTHPHPIPLYIQHNQTYL